MKKVCMALAVVAMMGVVCSCGNKNSKKAAEEAAVEIVEENCCAGSEENCCEGSEEGCCGDSTCTGETVILEEVVTE